MAEASEVRLARPGEGAAVAELVARTHRFATAIDSPLQAAVDAHGGLLRLDVADVPDGRGWCFGAYDRTDLVGVLYACTPVTFIQSFPFEHRDELVRSVIEIEILAVDEHRRQRGIATTRRIQLVEACDARSSVKTSLGFFQSWILRGRSLISAAMVAR